MLSLTLALAYLLVIVYASLQPFRGWRVPAADVYRFLSAPWPHYITLRDVLYNVSAYLPLGFLLTLGLRMWLRPAAAVAAGTLIAVMLSIAMEGVQMFLPARIANNVDVLANGVGALIGALAGPLFAPTQTIGARVLVLRNRVFVPGALPDVGIVLALLWVMTHMNPWAQVFGPGHVGASFDLPEMWEHSANLLAASETMVVLLNVLGMGLLLSTLLRAGARCSAVIGAFVVLALAVKLLASWALQKPTGSWVGTTPGIILGLLLAAPLLAVALRFASRTRMLMALICFVLALVAINLAPDNPYFNVPPQLARGGTSHFLSFWWIMRALSELWPLLAITYVSIAWWRHRRG